MPKSREDYRDEAVATYGEEIFALFNGEPQYKYPDGPDRFRQILVFLWEDGAAIGYHEG